MGAPSPEFPRLNREVLEPPAAAPALSPRAIITEPRVAYLRRGEVLASETRLGKVI
jgi:hypothetical protein